MEAKKITEVLQRIPVATSNSEQKLREPEADPYALTLDEVDAVLKAARTEKERMMKEREYAIKLRTERSYKIPTIGEFDDMVRAYGHELCDTDKNKFEISTAIQPIYLQLLHYFMGDKSGTLDISKGIAIGGGVGRGKTVLMQIFSTNPLQSFDVIPCQDIANLYADKEKGGARIIHRLGGEIQNPAYHECFGQKHLGICMDDLGTENNRKHFGNESNVIADIIFKRYSNKIPFNQTHFTTNLNADEIEQFYGERVRSRMREMFNIINIPVTAKDLRK